MFVLLIVSKLKHISRKCVFIVACINYMRVHLLSSRLKLMVDSYIRCIIICLKLESVAHHTSHLMHSTLSSNARDQHGITSNVATTHSKAAVVIPNNKCTNTDALKMKHCNTCDWQIVFHPVQDLNRPNYQNVISLPHDFGLHIHRASSTHDSCFYCLIKN